MSSNRIGPYEIKETLGSGGMGTVFKAWDERLRRWVAIKSLHPESELSPAGCEHRERLKREARAIAKLNHPSVAQVYDILSEEGRDFIVMELVDGEPLSQHLLGAPFDARSAADIARQIAEGLHTAHGEGIVHRDLKAENIMITAAGKVKILDFGLAKRHAPGSNEERLTQDGVVMGTSRCMSPEQAQGHDVDQRSDLFALGSLLYEMLTGLHPFQDASPLDTMQRIVHADPSGVGRLNPEVPEELDLLVDCLIEKRPDRRPRDAAEVAAALDAIVTHWSTAMVDDASLARITGLVRRRRLRRRRVKLAAMASVAIPVLAAAAFVLWGRPGPRLDIAVLEPQVESGSGIAPALLTTAIRTAVVNSAAQLDRIHVIDTSQVDAAGSVPRHVARAVAADEVIAIVVSPERRGWNVAIRRLDGATGRLLWSDACHVMQDDIQLLTETLSARLKHAYPDRASSNQPDHETTSPEDLEHYLQLVSQVASPAPGVRYENLLDELSALRHGRPSFLPVHLTEVDVACRLYATTHDPIYLTRATEVANDARRLAPADSRSLAAVFKVAIARGDVEEAATVLSVLEEIEPDSPELAVRRAQIAVRRGDRSTAAALLESSLRARPTWQTMWELAEIKLHGGDPAAARGLLEQALELVPRHHIVRSKLAEVELFHGDPERAARLYTELVSEGRSSTQLSNLGRAQMLLGRFAEAAVTFDLAVRVTPRDPISLTNRADAYAALGRADDAARSYTQALDAAEQAADPRHRDVLGVKARCLARLGRGVEAVTLVQDMLRSAPDSPASHFDAAVVFVVIGDRTSAVVNAVRTLELGMQPQWLRLPWFEPIADSEELRRAIETRKSPGSE